MIRLGLAAFAVSAYIKTVLCPSMSSYTPRMSSASLVIPPTLQPLAYYTQQHDLLIILERGPSTTSEVQQMFCAKLHCLSSFTTCSW